MRGGWAQRKEPGQPPGRREARGDHASARAVSRPVTAVRAAPPRCWLILAVKAGASRSTYCASSLESVPTAVRRVTTAPSAALVTAAETGAKSLFMLCSSRVGAALAPTASSARYTSSTPGELCLLNPSVSGSQYAATAARKVVAPGSGASASHDVFVWA